MALDRDTVTNKRLAATPTLSLVNQGFHEMAIAKSHRVGADYPLAEQVIPTRSTA